MRFSRQILSITLLLSALVPAAALENAVPDFGLDAGTGWIAGVPNSNEPIGDDFLPPPEGPGPVISAPDHPYIDNAYATRTGQQPTLHVADLSNPILQPW